MGWKLLIVDHKPPASPLASTDRDWQAPTSAVMQ
jgi:hypothetical protein